MSHAPFVIVLRCLPVHGSYTPIRMCTYIQNIRVCIVSHGQPFFPTDHTQTIGEKRLATRNYCLQACIKPRSLIDCHCWPQKCYPCSTLALHGNAGVQSECIKPVQSHSHLLKHVLVPANLLDPHTAQYTTPTDPMLYLLVIVDIYTCIHSLYLQYATSKNSCMRLSFSHPGSAVVTRFEC